MRFNLNHKNAITTRECVDLQDFWVFQHILVFTIVTLIIVFFLSLQLSGAELAIFYSGDCENCEVVKEFDLMPLIKKYGIKYIEYDIDKPENYELLVKIERALEDSDNQNAPIVLFDGILYSGKSEILNNLSAALELSRKHNNNPRPVENIISAVTSSTQNKDLENRSRVEPSDLAPKQIDANPKNAANSQIQLQQSQKQLQQPRRTIIYFYKQGCSICERIERDLAYLQHNRADLRILKYNIADTYAVNLYEFICEQRSIPQERRLIAPALFIGKMQLTNSELNIHYIEKTIAENNDTDIDITKFEAVKNQTNNRVLSRFSEFTMIAVILAGLIDGVNPCAFAVIIFFVSYFFVIKKEPRIILNSGLCFIAGVFIAYFTIGAGLAEVIYQLKILKYLTDILYYGFAGIMVILGIINFYDFILCKRGRKSLMLG